MHGRRTPGPGIGRRARSRSVLAIAVGSVLVAGCNQAARRPEPHSSAALLNSGGATKVTSRQAADVQFSLGRSLEDADDPTQAEAAYRKAIANDPKRADAHARLAVVLCQKGAFEAAIKEFDIALKHDPKSVEILCDRGYCFYLQRRWSEAESSLNLAIAQDARHPRSHTNLGLVLARRGDGDRAVSEFVRAGCDVADAKANLALILAMEDRLPEAERAYSEALAAKPDSAVAREGLRVLAQARSGVKPGRAGAIADRSAPPTDREVSRASVDLPALPPPGH